LPFGRYWESACRTRSDSAIPSLRACVLNRRPRSASSRRLSRTLPAVRSLVRARFMYDSIREVSDGRQRGSASHLSTAAPARGRLSLHLAG
jgi:hypothetical protein